MPRAPVWKEKQSQYLQRCSDRMLSDGTIKTYRNVLNVSLAYAREMGWPLNPVKLEPHHVREFYYQLVDDGTSTATQKLYTLVLLNFLHFCKNRNCEEVEFRISVSRARVNWLTEFEASQILSAADVPQIRAMIVLMLYCGLRREEVADLRRTAVRSNQLTVGGKGRKERTIPLDRQFWEAIHPYVEWADMHPKTDYFLSYLNQNGKMYGYTTSGVSSAIFRHSVEMGTPFSSHTFRRSFGRHLHKHGCPLPELMMLMGHSSVEMTIRYLGINDSDISHAIGFRPDYLGGL